VTEESIVSGFFAWHDSKRARFKPHQVLDAIGTMRLIKLVPKGDRRLIAEG
jgi:hypothetical protein